jgi:tRNA(Ile)-lysidine synthase
MSPGGEIRIGDRAVQYRIRPWTKRSRIRPAAGSEMFAAAAVGPVIILRHWRPGDRFQPLGFTGESKLQDIFVNRKVPATRRRGLLVATTGDHDIFWVESLPPGERFRVTDSTRRVLVWKCPPLP